MGAEFLFTLKINFRFLFILQITRRVEVWEWGLYIRTNKGEGQRGGEVEVCHKLAEVQSGSTF